MAFMSADHYEAGDIVQVNYPSVENEDSLKGEIVWSRPQGERGFINGMKFLDEHTHFRARQVEQICHIEAYRKLQRERHDRELTHRQAAAEWIERFADKFPR